MEVGAALVEQLAQRRDVLGQARRSGTRRSAGAGARRVRRRRGRARPRRRRSARHRSPAGRPEAQGRLERLDRVLRRSVAGPAVGEADRRIEQRGQPLLHERRLCQPLPPMGCGPTSGRGDYGGFVPSRSRRVHRQEGDMSSKRKDTTANSPQVDDRRPPWRRSAVLAAATPATATTPPGSDETTTHGRGRNDDDRGRHVVHGEPRHRRLRRRRRPRPPPAPTSNFAAVLAEQCEGDTGQQLLASGLQVVMGTDGSLRIVEILLTCDIEFVGAVDPELGRPTDQRRSDHRRPGEQRSRPTRPRPTCSTRSWRSTGGSPTRGSSRKPERRPPTKGVDIDRALAPSRRRARGCRRGDLGAGGAGDHGG